MADTYTLDTPITSTKGVLTSLTLTSPKGRTFAKYGVPYTYHREYDSEGATIAGHTRFDAKGVRGFLADMTGLDITDIDELSAYDFNRLIGYLQGAILNPSTPST